MNARATALSPSQDYGRGLAAASTAFFAWGLLPLYLKALQAVPVLQVTAHRMMWGCLFAIAWLAVRGELGQVWAALAAPKMRLRLLATATFISTNWLVYVWAIVNDRAVEASLGYFINPLLNVLMGVFVLSERLNRAQWTAVGIAAVSVVYLTWSAGHPPWIALILAFSFCMYGLLRKVVSVEALPGFATETLLVLPIGIGYLLWCEATGVGALGNVDLGTNLLLALGGPITALPLVLFAYGARRIPYSTVGLLQYIGPTIQLILAVFAFHEPFERSRALGFALIWLAIAIYLGDGLWRARKTHMLQ